MSKETFIKKSNTKHNFKYDYSMVEYQNSRTKVKIICPEHGEFNQTPKSHLRCNGCYLCGRVSIKNKLTKSMGDFKLEATKIHNNKFKYLDETYAGSHVKIRIECPIHGEFNQTPSNHLKGHGCPNCTYNNSNLDNFIKKANLKHNSKYSYNKSIYTMNKNKLIITCPIHGDFKQTPDKHTNKGTGCPNCKESKGEKKLTIYLGSKKIKFIKQYKFDDCKYKRKLPFDFYLPDYNICIEYNGIQHYKPVKYFGGEETFKLQQKRDKIKKEYCEKHNIPLIIIKYNESFINKLKKLIN